MCPHKFLTLFSHGPVPMVISLEQHHGNKEDKKQKATQKCKKRRDFHIWPKTDWTLQNPRSIWPSEVSEPREFEFISTETCIAISGWETPNLHCDFRDKNTWTKITVFVDSDFAGDPISRKRARRDLLAQIGNHTVKSGFHTSKLDSPERWRSEVLHSVEKRSRWTIPVTDAHSAWAQENYQRQMVIFTITNLKTPN